MERNYTSLAMGVFIGATLATYIHYAITSAASNNAPDSNKNDKDTDNNNNNVKSVIPLNTSNNKPINDTIDYPEEIKLELYSRSISFFGQNQFNQLQSSFIIIVGLGGVGSHAANMLIRSGIINIRLIDFDQVSLSSLNRHSLANISDVGHSKVFTMKQRLLSIIPWANIDIQPVMLTQSNVESCLSGQPNYVLDCIDDISTKASLIAYCTKNNIKILTSMGAGGKSDPTRIRIGTLKDCVRDPLASKLKWKLKSHEIIPESVMSIYSSEKPVCDLLPLSDEQKDNPAEFGAVDYIRLRVIPVLGTSPSIFGQAMTSYVLCDLANCLFVPESCEPMSKNLKHKMMSSLKKNELKRFNDSTSLNLDDDDLEFLVHQVWHGRCAVCDRRIGGNTGLILTRWRVNIPPTIDNLVLLAPHIAEQIEKTNISDIVENSVLTIEVVQRIEDRLKWAKEMIRFA